MLMLGGIDQGWREGRGWAQPARDHLRRAPAAPNRVHPGARSDGEVGKEVRTPPKALQANFCIRACVGGLKERAKLRSGGCALAPSPPGWLVPAPPPEGREQLSTTSPALPCTRGLIQPHQVCPTLGRTPIPIVPSPARPAPARTPCPARAARLWLAALAALAAPGRPGQLGRGVWSQRAPPGARAQV